MNAIQFVEKDLSSNNNIPDFKAGDTIEISLWPNQSDNDRAPTLKGKAQRPNPKFGNNAPAAAPAQPVDDSIPF